MTTTLISRSGGGTSAESSKSLWWKWVQTIPSLVPSRSCMLRESYAESWQSRARAHGRSGWTPAVCVANHCTGKHSIVARHRGMRLWMNTWSLGLVKPVFCLEKKTMEMYDHPVCAAGFTIRSLVSVRSATCSTLKGHRMNTISESSPGLQPHRQWALSTQQLAVSLYLSSLKGLSPVTTPLGGYYRPHFAGKAAEFQRVNMSCLGLTASKWWSYWIEEKGLYPMSGFVLMKHSPLSFLWEHQDVWLIPVWVSLIIWANTSLSSPPAYATFMSEQRIEISSQGAAWIYCTNPENQRWAISPSGIFPA